ncbi:MAG: P-loop NTPase fold protein [Saprospiraceae bacterium]
MDNIFGNQAVSGDDFHGRNDFIRHLKGILVSRNSFLLLGLRRTGKSSALKEIVRLIEIENPETIVINLDCQTYVSIHDFYKNIYFSLPHSWKSKMRKFLQDTKRVPTKLIDFITDHVEEVNILDLGSVKLRNEAIMYANPLMEELTAFFKEQKKHIVLILDELPFLFENISESSNEPTKLEIEMILTTLRSWRNIGVSQAICGSLNLHLQLETLGISRKLLGGIVTQTLPKYTKEEAKGLLTKLAKEGNISLEERHFDLIIELLPDCIPQFLQIFFFSLKTHWNGEAVGVKTIFDKYVYPSIVSDFEYQFNERFAKLPPSTMALGNKILNSIYKTPNISEAKLLESLKDENVYSILLILVNQEFLVLNEHNQIDFSFEIVRNWWIKKTM